MKELIRVQLGHESHKEVFPKELHDEFSEDINSYLEEFKEAVITYHGYVKVIKTNSGNFRIVPICDNEDLRDIMDDLLPSIVAGK